MLARLSERSATTRRGWVWFQTDPVVDSIPDPLLAHVTVTLEVLRLTLNRPLSADFSCADTESPQSQLTVIAACKGMLPLA